MRDCDCQKNNKKPIDDGSTIDGTAAKKHIGDGLIITTIAATTAVIFFGPRLVGMRQGNAFNIYVVDMVCVFTGMGNVIKNLI